LTPEPPNEPEEHDETPPEAVEPEVQASDPVEPEAVEPERPLPVEPEPEPEPLPTLDEPPPIVPPPPRFEPTPPSPPRKRKGGFLRFLRLALLWGFIVVVVIPVGLTAIYRFVPPPVTILMIQRVFEGKGWDYRWRSIDRISPALVQAAIAAEDARFCEHNGFDFEAMEKAWKSNQKGGRRIKGGSTISQQTAKNVFLWPARSYVRKGLEAYYTTLIEAIWGKRRIMEVYLNVAEMGAGTYGAEAAARRYFGVSADQLTRAQAARLVAILPNPLKYKAVASGPYVAKRSRRIGAAAGTVRNDGLAACVGRMRAPTRAEKAEPEPVRKPTVRRPAPERKSEPLPVAAPEPAAPILPEPEPLAVPAAPSPETPQPSD